MCFVFYSILQPPTWQTQGASATQVWDDCAGTLARWWGAQGGNGWSVMGCATQEENQWAANKLPFKTIQWSLETRIAIIISCHIIFPLYPNYIPGISWNMSMNPRKCCLHREFLWPSENSAVSRRPAWRRSQCGGRKKKMAKPALGLWSSTISHYLVVRREPRSSKDICSFSPWNFGSQKFPNHKIVQSYL